MSNVLIIGNGFDIYHGLPTHYDDFLFLARHWDVFYKLYSSFPDSAGDKDELISVRLDEGKLVEDSLEDYAKHKYIFNDLNIRYLNDHINSNSWIKYFLDTKFNGRGWVDFEAEIKEVLEAIDFFFENLHLHAGTNQPVSNSSIINSDIRKKVKHFLNLTESKYTCNLWGVLSRSDVEEPKLLEHRLFLVEKLKKELNNLNECLRLYMVEFVESVECNGYSEQVESLGDVCLLNFNYTYTYKRVYGNLRRFHHPIHGDCINGNLVLGISDDSFKNKLEYIYFAKYFQRIQKRTGTFYKEWIQKPKSEAVTSSDVPAEVYIMGHSLAETDKGVLDDFFRNMWVEKITIFYHNQQAYENMVINLVAMYGKDYVIEEIGKERIVFEELKAPKSGR